MAYQFSVAVSRPGAPGDCPRLTKDSKMAWRRCKSVGVDSHRGVEGEVHPRAAEGGGEDTRALEHRDNRRRIPPRQDGGDARGGQAVRADERGSGHR